MLPGPHCKAFLAQQKGEVIILLQILMLILRPTVWTLMLLWNVSDPVPDVDTDLLI